MKAVLAMWAFISLSLGLSARRNLATRTLSSIVGKHSIGLAAFQERIKNKPESAVKTVIWPSTPLDIDLAARLSGAAFGFEGETVFSTLFESNECKWIPPVKVIEQIKMAVKQELSRGPGK